MITLESYDRDTGKRHYGMSTAAGGQRGQA